VKSRTLEDGTQQSFEYYADDAANPNDRRQLYQLKTNVPTAIDKGLKIRRQLSAYDRFGKPQTQLETQADYNTVVQLNQVRGGATDTVATFDHGMLVSESTQIFKNSTKEDIALPHPVIWHYDAAGRRSTMTLPSGAGLTYAYNDRSLPKSATILGGGTTIHTLWAAEYGGDFGLMTKEDRWNAAVKHKLDYTGTEHVGLIKTVTLGSGTTGLVSSAEYDQRGLMTKRGIWPTAATTWSRAFLYDGLNRLSTSLPIPGRDQFGKDDYQLDASESRSRDTIINDVNVTYGVGAFSRYESATVPGLDQVKLFRSTLPAEIELPFSVINTRSVSFGWDTRGNQTSNGVFSSGWDPFNRLTGSTSFANTSYNLGYYYDSLGRRAYRIEGRPEGITHTQLIYDGASIVEEFRRADTDNPNTAVLVARTNASVVGTPAVYESWTGPTRVYAARVIISDMDGSVAGVANDAGIIQEKLTYSSTGIGAIIGQANSRGSALVPYGWQGMYREPLTGRLYQGGDVFDPLHGMRMRIPTGYHPVLNVFGMQGKNLNRGFGLLRAAGSYVEASLGSAVAVGASWTGIGIPIGLAGAAVAAHGADGFQAGIRQFATGENIQSFTEQGLVGMGMSDTAAGWTDAGIGVVGSGWAGFARSSMRAATQAAEYAPNLSGLDDALSLAPGLEVQWASRAEEITGIAAMQGRTTSSEISKNSIFRGFIRQLRDASVGPEQRRIIINNIKSNFTEYQSVKISISSTERSFWRRWGGNAAEYGRYGAIGPRSAVYSRERLAILKNWNSLEYETRLRIRKGSLIIEGPTAPKIEPSGEIRKGGGWQLFVPNLDRDLYIP
jgi:YD repeat-containing protein